MHDIAEQQRPAFIVRQRAIGQFPFHSHHRVGLIVTIAATDERRTLEVLDHKIVQFVAEFDCSPKLRIVAHAMTLARAVVTPD
ncbi:hypothetical protein Rwratislav_47095, partial [Rhodococcus wratislaviensis IFP 2016]